MIAIPRASFVKYLSRLLLALLVPVVSASAAELYEPKLYLAGPPRDQRRVALTLDACGGRTDTRILLALVENRIPATIFVTGKWLRGNPDAVRTLRDHRELFEIENHGGSHVPAVDRPMRIYGIPAAGSPKAVADEVEAGAAGILAQGLDRPRWFRGATAKYSASAIAEIRRMGYRVAGYSLNADQGALLGAASVEKRVAAARDGDVILAHVNQPTRSAGEGLVRGLLRLKAEGVTFLRLSDTDEDGSDGTTLAD
jgi:peptidoglycan/xylan/chitin deacetylase (PgdA/CDA1 family)